MKGEQEKGVAPGRWTAREQELRAKLSEEQAVLLARKIREQREANARLSVAGFARSARLAPEKVVALQNAVMSKVKTDEGPLILEAHGLEMSEGWGRFLTAFDEGLSELSSTLTEEELKAMRKMLEQWKSLKR